MQISEILDSVAIEFDIRTQCGEMVKVEQQYVQRSKSSGKFRVVLMDLPWNGTGCKLPFETLRDSEWMDQINFDELLDDGLVFMWVTNRSFDGAVVFMKSRGWKRI